MQLSLRDPVSRPQPEFHPPPPRHAPGGKRATDAGFTTTSGGENDSTDGCGLCNVQGVDVHLRENNILLNFVDFHKNRLNLYSDVQNVFKCKSAIYETG